MLINRNLLARELQMRATMAISSSESSPPSKQLHLARTWMLRKSALVILPELGGVSWPENRLCIDRDI